MYSSNQELVTHIKQRSTSYLDGISRDQKVIDAMLRVDRINFIPSEVRDSAYEDNPLPIGSGQTCSQPSMVAFMLDKLEIEKGNIILEIGAGCGYASAIASILCGNQGIVYASEIIPELAQYATANLCCFENIKVISADGSCGFKEYSLFDRIFVSAGVSTSNFNSNILLSQLRNNGILLYPESYGNIYKLKKAEDKVIKETFYGVSFVPLRGENA